MQQHDQGASIIIRNKNSRNDYKLDVRWYWHNFPLKSLLQNDNQTIFGWITAPFMWGSWVAKKGIEACRPLMICGGQRKNEFKFPRGNASYYPSLNLLALKFSFPPAPTHKITFRTMHKVWTSMYNTKFVQFGQLAAVVKLAMPKVLTLFNSKCCKLVFRHFLLWTCLIDTGQVYL